MQIYDHLIAILDSFISEVGGGMRIRGVKTALLIEKATEEGRGISVSEIARETGAPLENVRRHMAKHVALGALRYVKDPTDDRVTRVVSTEKGSFREAAKRIEERIAALEPPECIPGVPGRSQD
jgi:DNA-binding MarR family transcriptional regulator